MTRTHAWIEGMRLRTLPVSAAGVITAVGLAAAAGFPIPWLWAGLCLLFALLAQIAANFANEYFDFKAGIDSTGRRGPQRGVANGIISPRAMLAATLLTLGLACALGVCTIARGGWQMLPWGIAIAIGALAYSAGPWPLSRHRMGEIAVILFFGLLPVGLTYYLLTLTLSLNALICGFGLGCWIAMVILVNNFRDITSDRLTGKHTLSTLIGPQGSALLYLTLGQLAAISLWLGGEGSAWGFLPIIPAALGFAIGLVMYSRPLTGAQCTRLLAVTSASVLLTSIIFALLHLIP